MGVEILFPIINRATAPIKSVNIDDLSSQLNRTFMFYLSLTFAITITIRQQLGGAYIACDGFSRDEEYERFAEEWCWSSGIYTIKEAYEMSNRVSPYPGIIPENLPACIEMELISGGRVECPEEKDVKPFTRIYQSWYPFVMFYYWLTALMFFLPYQLYKVFGFEDVKAVVAMLQNPVEDGFEKKELIKRGSVWLYLKSTMTLSNPSVYSSFIVKHSLAFYALAVKVMYLGNTLLMYWLTHKMFKFGSFAEYGLLWDSRNPLNNVQSLVQEKLFPKVAACEVKRFGASGLEEDQGMCMLALNVLNQYLFLIFWFCLLFVTIVNTISLLLTLLNIISPCFMLQQFLLASSLDRSPAVGVISKLYLDCGSSLRFIMTIFAWNVDPKLFGEILVQLNSLLAKDESPRAEVLKRRSKKVKVPSPRKPKLLFHEEIKKKLIKRTERKDDNLTNFTNMSKISKKFEGLKKRNLLQTKSIIDVSVPKKMSELEIEEDFVLAPTQESGIQNIPDTKYAQEDVLDSEYVVVEQSVPETTRTEQESAEESVPETGRVEQEGGSSDHIDVEETPPASDIDREVNSPIVQHEYQVQIDLVSDDGSAHRLSSDEAIFPLRIPIVKLNGDVLSLRSESLQ